MKTENEGLENRVLAEKPSRPGHHIIYASLTTLFGAGAVMAGIGAHNVNENAALLTLVSGYSAMLSGLTIVWWRNDFLAYRRNLYK